MTAWGIVALICGAVAILSANVSAIVPDSVLGALHASRLQGADISQLRAQVANLRIDSSRIRDENSSLTTRLALAQQANGEVTRRVGALEVSIPKLLEALPKNAEIDRNDVTASIGKGDTVNFAAEGGSVSIQQKPFLASGAQAPAASQPMPAMPLAVSIRSDPNAFGVALGDPVEAETVKARWDGVMAKIGPLLLGLGPMLAENSAKTAKHLVVGPITDIAQAKALCDRIGKVGIACAPVPFVGTPLTN
ncbi:MAG: hypothetical protein JWN11_642 [Hyphomicrobiales bacterium]|nr:hypothetical protein [Hyphomicrobiales bacterium]